MAEARADDGPYVGPRPFEPADRERFYGRGEEARELASLVVAHRVVLLYAASGAGKTSLLNAGAIPLLEAEDGFEALPTVRLRGLADAAAPGNPFIANLLSNLQRETGDDGPEPATLPGFLAGRPHPEASDALPAPRALVIDQFEELFTLYPERWAQRGEVFDQLGEALDQDPLLRVVLAIREDFIAQLDPYAARLPTRLRTRMRLAALRRPAPPPPVALPRRGAPAAPAADPDAARGAAPPGRARRDRAAAQRRVAVVRAGRRRAPRRRPAEGPHTYIARRERRGPRRARRARPAAGRVPDALVEPATGRAGDRRGRAGPHRQRLRRALQLL